jgi:hypothetical protein
MTGASRFLTGLVTTWQCDAPAATWGDGCVA